MTHRRNMNACQCQLKGAARQIEDFQRAVVRACSDQNGRSPNDNLTGDEPLVGRVHGKAADPSRMAADDAIQSPVGMPVGLGHRRSTQCKLAFCRRLLLTLATEDEVCGSCCNRLQTVTIARAVCAVCPPVLSSVNHAVPHSTSRLGCGGCAAGGDGLEWRLEWLCGHPLCRWIRECAAGSDEDDSPAFSGFVDGGGMSLTEPYSSRTLNASLAR